MGIFFYQLIYIASLFMSIIKMLQQQFRNLTYFTQQIKQKE